MNTTSHAHSFHGSSAADALYDKLEQDLLALTIAPLDCRAGAPLQVVDEFADDFSSAWSMRQPQ